MARIALLLALTACGVQNIGGGAGLDLPFLDVVYECDVRDITTDQRGESYTDTAYEFCFDGSSAELAQQIVAAWDVDYARCGPTQRHAGPCVACCSDDCPAHGSNALNGSWCQ